MTPASNPLPRFAILLVVAAVVVAADHQTVRTTPATGALSGLVTGVEGSAKRPVGGARVSASMGDRKVETVADSLGRFAMEGLPAGRYRVVASQPGFLTGEFGSFRAGHEGTPVALAAGDRVERVDIELERGAVITGSVMRVGGEPASLSAVTASSADGISQAARADEHGAYRIEALPPGSYLIATSVVPVKARNRMAPFFFPGTFDPDQAQQVTVGPAEERHGISLTVPGPGTGKVNGRLVTESGDVPGRVALSLWTPRALVRDILRVDANGTFVVTDVMPGSYLLRATYGPAPPGGPRDLDALLQWAPTHFAFHRLEIPASGEVEVVLRLAEVATVSGELRVGQSREGAIAAPNVVVSMAPVEVPGPVIGAEGTTRFAVRGVMPGSYRLAATVRDDNAWWVASMERQGANLFVEPLRVESGSGNIGGIVVTLAQGRSDVSGRVLDRSGRPASGYWVTLISTDPRSWAAARTGALRTRPDTSGAFDFVGVPAREYVLALADAALPDRWRTPDWLEPLVRSGVRLTLPAGQPVRQDIRIR